MVSVRRMAADGDKVANSIGWVIEGLLSLLLISTASSVQGHSITKETEGGQREMKVREGSGGLI